MKNFSRTFQNELYKIASNKQILKVCIAIAVFFVILTLSYNLIFDISTGAGFPNQGIGSEDIDMQILATESAIENYDPDITIGVSDTTLYQLEAKLAILKYAKANNLELSNYSLFGQMGVDSAGYIMAMLDIIATIATLFCVIMAVKNFLNEKANGTLKMQMIRPVGRSSFLFAKMLSTFVVGVAIIVTFMLLTQIVAIAKFGTRTKDIIYVLNAKHVGVMKFVPFLILNVGYSIFQMWCYMQLAYFICSLLWKKESAMGLTIALLLLGDALDSILSLIYVGYVGFFNNISFLNALSMTNPPVVSHTNLYIMLAITLLYQVGFTFYSFYHFKKCDIA